MARLTKYRMIGNSVVVGITLPGKRVRGHGASGHPA